MINIFGGIVQSGMAIAAQSAWQKLPSAEISCVDRALRQHGLSINLAIQQGIGPSDPRVFGDRSSCRNEAAGQQLASSSQSILTNYTVDGLVLGGRVQFGSAAYQKYACVPSEQFSGFTLCRKKTQEHEARGSYSSANTILHSGDGTVGYINRFLEPAFFAEGEAEADIDRLSKKYGTPKVLKIPPAAVAQFGMIVSWGDISLVPIEPALVAELATGREIRAGFLLDYIGDPHRSARLGLPIYRLNGGAGFVWVASWGENQRGILRFFAANPLFYDSAAADRLAADRAAEGAASEKIAAEKAAALKAVQEMAAAEKAAIEKAAAEKAVADEAMRKAEREIEQQKEAKFKGIEYAASSDTKWTISRKKNEMTDRTYRSGEGRLARCDGG